MALSEGQLERFVNHILESAELIATRFEEGLSIVFAGTAPGGASEQSSSAGPQQQQQDLQDDILMEMDEDMVGSPLEGLADSVLGSIMSKQGGPQTPMEHIEAFRSAIRWSEPFILSLIAFQVFMFFLCVWAARKNRGMVARISVLVSVGILVRCSEQLNRYASRNFEVFATQNYFDRGGIFVGIFFCGPLLLNCFMMLSLMLREASHLLVEVKQMEIKKKRKQGKKSEKEDTPSSRGKKTKEAKKTD